MKARAGLLALALAGGATVAGEAQQYTEVRITPTSMVVMPNQAQVTITIYWCGFPGDPPMGQNTFLIDTRTIKLNGVDHTGDFDLVWDQWGCGFYGNVSDESLWRSTGTITVDTTTGPVSVLAQVWNPWGYMFGAAEDFTPPEPRRGVTVTAGAQFVDAPPSFPRTDRFVVRNVGTQIDTFTITWSGCGAGAIGVCTYSHASGSSVALATGASVTATATYISSSVVGATGVLRLKATRGYWETTVDSSWTDVTVASVPTPDLVIIGMGPGVSGTVTRELCVTASVGDGTAMECGDLRVAHALPSVRTHGTVRTPTLLYNSQHAQPKPIIQADLRLPTWWGSVPTTVTACIVLYPSNVTAGCRSWPGSQWSALGERRRIAIAADSGATSTGLYPFRIQVSATGGLSVEEQWGEFAVVNRQQSPFGAGWWLAGLEEFHWFGDGRRMLVRGDGATQMYNPAGTNRWLAADNPTRPDTLVYDTLTTNYIRLAPNGVQVVYAVRSGAWRHVWTENRHGHRTYFDWGTRLDSIRVPIASGTVPKFTFAYGTILSQVTAPGGRVVQLYSTGIRVDSIRDPDPRTTTRAVGFGYGSGVDQYRINSRIDRSGNATSFAYDTGRRLRTVSRPLGVSMTIVASETRGLDSATVLDSAFTMLDGPRTDVADQTRFWINGRGAPVRTRNAPGQETRVRYSATWPGMADSVMGPNRLTSRAWFNSRGLLDSSTVFNAVGTGQHATTRYRWNAKWRYPTSVRSAAGLLDSTVYNATYGDISWTQRGANGARRVTYQYNSLRQLTRVITPAPEPGAAPETLLVRYNTLGNVRWQRSAGGMISLVFGDAIGRDSLSIAPRGVGTQATDSAQVVAIGLRQYTRYDVMDRDTVSITVGPQTTVPNRTVFADTIRLRTTYDAEGNRTSSTRYYTNNFATPGSVYAAGGSEWEIDSLGRVWRQREPSDQAWTTFVMDPAGNVTSTVTARGDTIRTIYDALGRATRRIIPQKSFTGSICNYPPSEIYNCLYTFPTREGPDLCSGVDTVRYQYDAAGNMIGADNNWAIIRRRYTPTGLMARDSMVMRQYRTAAPNPCGGGDRTAGSYFPGDFDKPYSIDYVYDLDGRRRELRPTFLTYCSGACVQRYAYNDTTGALDSLISPLGQVTRYRYDFLGRNTVTYHPGDTTERHFDRDSRVVRRLGVDTDDTLQYDATGRVIAGTINMPGLGNRPITMAYSGLGALNYAEGLTTVSAIEEMMTDALGNRIWVRDQLNSVYSDRTRYYDYATDGRLLGTELGSGTCGSPGTGLASCHPSYYGHEQFYQHDAAGNTTAAWGKDTRTTDPASRYEDESRSYFDAANRLVYHNRHVGIAANSQPGGVFEEYRYDALGRRIMVRSRRTVSCASGFQCGSYIERTVWDGDQVLWELRGGGGDSLAWPYLESGSNQGGSGEGYQYGNALYVHGPGIDQPAGVIATRGDIGTVWVTPHANWQGDYTYATLANGTPCPGNTGCPYYLWTGNTTTADGGSTSTEPTVPETWLGNLLTNKADGSGLQYMRNRYYDPRSGRFTQQDPIGLAGGLNLYGFAQGDPVNFSDPFGLKVYPYGSRARGAIATLLEASATFATIYRALDDAPTSRVSIAVRAARTGAEFETLERNSRRSGMNSAYAERDLGSSAGRVIYNPEGGDEHLMGWFAHEFIHLAGAYADEVGGSTGVPGGCGNQHGYQGAASATCAGLESTIQAEVEAWRRAQNGGNGSEGGKKQ